MNCFKVPCALQLRLWLWSQSSDLDWDNPGMCQAVPLPAFHHYPGSRPKHHPAVRFSHRMYVYLAYTQPPTSLTRRHLGTPEAFLAWVYSGPLGKSGRLSSSTLSKISGQPGPSWVLSLHFRADHLSKRLGKYKEMSLGPIPCLCLSCHSPFATVLFYLPPWTWTLFGTFCFSCCPWVSLCFLFLYSIFFFSYQMPFFPSGIAYMLLYILQLRPHIYKQGKWLSYILLWAYCGGLEEMS